MKIAAKTMLLNDSIKGLAMLGLISALAACAPQVITTTTEQTTTRQAMPVTSTTVTTTQSTTP